MSKKKNRRFQRTKASYSIKIHNSQILLSVSINSAFEPNDISIKSRSSQKRHFRASIRRIANAASTKSKSTVISEVPELRYRRSCSPRNWTNRSDHRRRGRTTAKDPPTATAVRSSRRRQQPGKPSKSQSEREREKRKRVDLKIQKKREPVVGGFTRF